MRQLLFVSIFIVLAGTEICGQLPTYPPTPNYDRSKFQQSIGFHKTKQYVFFDDFNTYAEFLFDLDFTIEFWIKIPSSVTPGTMVLQTSNFDINFALENNSGVTTPSLLFLVKSGLPDERLPDGGNKFPDEETYYHITGQRLPYFNDWFHVAIVRNRTGNSLIPIHEKNTDPGSMRMYINGITSEYPSFAPEGDLLPLDGGISLASGHTAYLKIDELRIWNRALSAPEIYENMNEAIDHTSTGMIAYYDFNQTDPNSSFIPNEARGPGSPATDGGNELAGYVQEFNNSGPAPVFGIDQDYISVLEGNWENDATWGGSVPGENEIVIIDQTVTLNQPRTQSGLIFRAPAASMRMAGPASYNKLVYTNGHILRLLSPPVDGNETSYIVTNGGSLIVENIPDYAGTQIPVGTEEAYRPVTVSQLGARPFTLSFVAKDDISPSVAADAEIVNASWELAPVVSSNIDFPNNRPDVPYQIGFQWNMLDESGHFSRTYASIANYHDERWNILASGDVETINDGTFALAADNVTQFSPFIITSNQGSLPVRLATFDATKEGSVAILKWSASDASNFSRFEIERSADARAWTTLGIEYAAGQGVALQHYTYHDPIPALISPKLYYRIKMVDLDASYAYSPVKIVAGEIASRPVFYPNPAERKSEIRLNFPGDLSAADLKIISLTGREVFRQTGLSGGSVKLPDLPTGLYIFSVKDRDGSVHKEKILIR